MCELCGFDAAYYGDVLRPFERLNICFGCYAVDILGFSWDFLNRSRIAATAIRDEFDGLGATTSVAA